MYLDEVLNQPFFNCTWLILPEIPTEEKKKKKNFQMKLHRIRNLDVNPSLRTDFKSNIVRP